MIPFAALYSPESFKAGVADSFSLSGQLAHVEGPFSDALSLKLRSLYRDGRIAPISSLLAVDAPEIREWQAFAECGKPTLLFLKIFGHDLFAHATLDVDFNDARLRSDDRLMRAYFQLCKDIDTGSTNDRWRFDRVFDARTNTRFVLHLDHWRASLALHGGRAAAA